MSRLFRKEALEKLQSPEQLDQLLRVVSPNRWPALLMVWALMAAVILWGIFGQVATKVDGSGIFIYPGGVPEVVADGTGRVQRIDIKPGDTIRSGDTVAHLVNPELEKRLLEAKAEVAEIRAERDAKVKLIETETEDKLRSLEAQRHNLNKKKALIQDRHKWLTDRVDAYEKLSRDGAVARQQVYDVRWQLDQTVIELDKTQQHFTDLTAEVAKARESKQARILQEQFKLESAERKKAILQEQTRQASEIVSTIRGRVISILTDKGKVVHQGDPIAAVQPVSSSLSFQLYVSALKGKKVDPGMKAQITPSTVKRDEYGYMLGNVIEVSQYPVSSQAMMSVLNDDELVKSLTSTGPVISVRIEPVPDPSTASGFKWSSQKGATVTVNSGTLGSADVVVREQPPITLVVPALKKLFGI
jgi:HlyD family secretion protein